MLRRGSWGVHVGNWWRQADHFDWFHEYMQSRRLLHVSRGVIVIVTLSLIAVAVALNVSQAETRGGLAAALGWTAVANGIGCAMLWLVCWPSRFESAAFVVVLDVSIAIVCLVQTNEMVGLVGVTAFAVTGGYIACCHTSRLMVYHIAGVALVGAFLAYRYVTGGGDALLALAVFALGQVINTLVPFWMQFVVHTLGADVVDSDRDPLTGLLNRRALFQRLSVALLSTRPGEEFLSVSMIDLDRFKNLNDTSGHDVGDKALMAVGDILRTISPDRTLVGRIGGEEFLIAQFLDTENPGPVPQDVCDAIDRMPYRVTASVGAALGQITDVSPREFEDFVFALYRNADRAMYEAKRSGGNQIRYLVVTEWR
ncbi:GGDEF domain-containing protein [Mycolicibacterium iranicum]|uniref:GGDEF domain-containing protein n=1 Tax=Mycolicibacterium iranicum TaxID=912594 RepID=A0ABT4HDJ8_MYCIR|nr:GGDEF domain-containing protein [Mycolicibacterium iranicum]MCZ0727772.1 GGDEF domain-containing protein [Mycolicibacterium iranicum]